ncbi:D-aminoacyl-tRNA deacylase, partial [Candidatus Woesearchaeota archaeon]|nr:D-aminoacyl-tRNA deacylase [Candidatus Woesearchaeota archaeon]
YYCYDENIKLYEMEEESIFCENIDKEIDADLFMFATKHMSKSGIPSLSVHSHGNWGSAEQGGRDKELCFAPPSLLKFSLQTIEKFAKEQYGEKVPFDIVQECTHHGPYLEKPVMFIEIGSTEKEWGMKDAAVVIARTIMHALTNPIPECKVAFGVGGIHTCIAFRRVIDTTDYAFGHVCPKYMLVQLDESMIRRAMARNTEPCETAMVDWKGMSGEKERIINLLNEMNISWKKSRDIYPH